MMRRRDVWIVCAGIAFVAALWFWYGIVGTLTVQKPGGVDMYERAKPVWFDPDNPIVVHPEQGEVLDVYSLIYGKDYLVFKVRRGGQFGYVNYYGSDVRFQSPSGSTY